MPPIKHALLGASSAARWIACPPSARATENLPGETSKYAEEGTRAHELCEAHLRYSLSCWEHGEDSPMLGESIRLDGQPDDPAEMVRAPMIQLKWCAPRTNTSTLCTFSGGFTSTSPRCSSSRKWM